MIGGKSEVEEDTMEQKKVRGSSSNITDDFFERLKSVSIADHEEQMLFVEERKDVQIDNSLFDRLDQMQTTPPSQRGKETFRLLLSTDLEVRKTSTGDSNSNMLATASFTNVYKTGSINNNFVCHLILQ